MTTPPPSNVFMLGTTRATDRCLVSTFFMFCSILEIQASPDLFLAAPGNDQVRDPQDGRSGGCAMQDEEVRGDGAGHYQYQQRRTEPGQRGNQQRDRSHNF